MPANHSSSYPNVPSNAWAPDSNASICVYWENTRPGTFEIMLQLIDRALIPPGDPGIILYTTMSSTDRVQQPFSLYDGDSGAIVLSGRFVLRPDARGFVQLWLRDARYPGGFTAEAQISGGQA